MASSRGQMINQPTEGGDGDGLSPLSGKSYGFDCKCRCSCDKSTIMSSTITALPDFQHPVCYVHEELNAESHNSLEDNSSERSVGPSSHQPLIHREDSGLAQHNPTQSKSTLVNSRQLEDSNFLNCPSESEESHNQDFNHPVLADSTRPLASSSTSPEREKTDFTASSI